MNVLNIHGYKGTPHNAAYGALCSQEVTIVSPEIDYDKESPEDILRKLTDLCASEDIQSIVGTSLGGFFALVISAKKEIPVILVNPCLQPEVILPGLGYEGDLSPFTDMAKAFAEIDLYAVSCIIGDHDEVIGSHEFTKELIGEYNIDTVKGGMHSGETLHLEEYFPDMLKYNHIYNLNFKKEYAFTRRACYIKGDKFLYFSENWEDPRITEFTVPKGIKVIGDKAFFQHIYLEKITLPEGLEEIGKCAFDKCAALREINIPSSVRKIGEHAFRNCLRLKYWHLKFPENAEICGDLFKATQEEYEELDYILFDQRDNPLLR